MEIQNKENQFPDAVSRDLDGGFTVTLPYGGAFIPQKQGVYVCVGTEEHDGHKPIFGIQGVNLGAGGVVISPETIISPVTVCNYLEGHENLTRELEGLGTEAAPIQTRGNWYYYVHEKPNTNVKKVVALSLGHWGELDVTCTEEDIFFVLDNTTAED